MQNSLQINLNLVWWIINYFYSCAIFMARIMFRKKTMYCKCNDNLPKTANTAYKCRRSDNKSQKRWKPLHIVCWIYISSIILNSFLHYLKCNKSVCVCAYNRSPHKYKNRMYIVCCQSLNWNYESKYKVLYFKEFRTLSSGYIISWSLFRYVTYDLRWKEKTNWLYSLKALT